MSREFLRARLVSSVLRLIASVRRPPELTQPAFLEAAAA